MAEENKVFFDLTYNSSESEDDRPYIMVEAGRDGNDTHFHVIWGGGFGEDVEEIGAILEFVGNTLAERSGEWTALILDAAAAKQDKGTGEDPENE